MYGTSSYTMEKNAWVYSDGFWHFQWMFTVCILGSSINPISPQKFMAVQKGSTSNSITHFSSDPSDMTGAWKLELCQTSPRGDIKPVTGEDLWPHSSAGTLPVKTEGFPGGNTSLQTRTCMSRNCRVSWKMRCLYSWPCSSVNRLAKSLAATWKDQVVTEYSNIVWEGCQYQ